MRRYSSAKNRNRRVALETLAAREADLAAFKATHRSPFTFVKEGHGEEELVEECFKVRAIALWLLGMRIVEPVCRCDQLFHPLLFDPGIPLPFV